MPILETILESGCSVMSEHLLNTAALVPILTFVVGYVVNEWKKRRDERIARRKYLLALCTEIELNTDLLDLAIRSIPTTGAFRQFLQSGPGQAAAAGADPTRAHQAAMDPVCYRPHLINNYLNFVFKQNIGSLGGYAGPAHPLDHRLLRQARLDRHHRRLRSRSRASHLSRSAAGRRSWSASASPCTRHASKAWRSWVRSG